MKGDSFTGRPSQGRTGVSQGLIFCSLSPKTDTEARGPGNRMLLKLQSFCARGAAILEHGHLAFADK